MSGSLYVFEGPDGVGKTTIIEHIYNEFTKGNRAVIKLGFPGYDQGTLGNLVHKLHERRFLFEIDAIHPTSLQLLHIAAHVDSIAGVIIPSLEDNKIVLLDRYWWSTKVYGKVSGIEDRILERMIEIEKDYWSGIIPNKLFLIDRKKDPLKENIDIVSWSQIKQEYRKLYEIEKHSHPSLIVENDSSLSVTVGKILKEIKLSL